MRASKGHILAPLVVAIAAAMFAACVGCAGYSTYPPVNGDTAINNPNTPPMPKVIARALHWTIERHPVPGEYAVNLPEHLVPGKARSIVRELPDGARLLTQRTKDLPIYHVSRIWIRGTHAEVDVHRPILDVAAPDDEPAHQVITVALDGGFKQWRPVSGRSRVIGADEPPPLHLIEPEEESDGDLAPAENASDEN